ncbi:MAG: HNH endonuclease, partial [Streptosporangiales bacterium]|nr:HNH endonuclease [Streptosporangiales bacterium]
RRALIARDHGCVVAGCDAPPQYTQAHHVTWWSRGGTTDIDNLALVCTVHHTAVHDGTIDLVMHNGRAHTVPPRWLDPTQRPRLNRVHDRPP